MQTKFILTDSTARAIKIGDDMIQDKLPPQIYTVAFCPDSGFYLEISKDLLKIPDIIYGNAEERADKCIQTYKNRTSSTGILLTGHKGTGKTLQLAILANKVITDLKLPVILIKQAYSGAQFTTFLETLGESTIIFDEFGKMYKSGRIQEGDISQKTLLSFLDGIDKMKRMIIMTENSTIDIDDFLLNRPGRIYYHFKYDKMPEPDIKEYCKKFKIKTTPTEDIIQLSRKSRVFSFDMLQTIIEEHQRFNTSIKDTIKELNIDTSESIKVLYQPIKMINNASNKEIKITNATPFEINTYQYRDTDFQISYKGTKANEECIEYFEKHHLVYQSGDTQIFKTQDFTLTLKVLPPQNNSYQIYL